MKSHETASVWSVDEKRESEGAPAEAPAKQRRGFAVMDPEKRRLIASLGGKACHQKGTGHEWSPDKAREAGRKGGLAAREARRRARAAAASTESAVSKQ